MAATGIASHPLVVAARPSTPATGGTTAALPHLRTDRRVSGRALCGIIAALLSACSPTVSLEETDNGTSVRERFTARSVPWQLRSVWDAVASADNGSVSANRSRGCS